MELILKICEAFRIIDFPTAYIMIFTGAWLLVLIAAVAFVKPKNPDVYRILGFIPLLHFAVFYLLNYTKGYFLFSMNPSGNYIKRLSHLIETARSFIMEPKAGIEPATYSLRVNCSTPEPLWRAIKIYPFES